MDKTSGSDTQSEPVFLFCYPGAGMNQSLQKAEPGFFTEKAGCQVNLFAKIHLSFPIMTNICRILQ
ncbi:MAG TPA: hypothetical protein DIT05_12750 [Morganella sp. (in: Bacteria)]|nr:hypothetical protein [Morganella sp. (in: enterobacteria)]